MFLEHILLKWSTCRICFFRLIAFSRMNLPLQKSGMNLVYSYLEKLYPMDAIWGVETHSTSYMEAVLYACKATNLYCINNSYVQLMESHECRFPTEKLSTWYSSKEFTDVNTSRCNDMSLSGSSTCMIVVISSAKYVKNPTNSPNVMQWHLFIRK